jgi:hypothetical protein
MVRILKAELKCDLIGGTVSLKVETNEKRGESRSWQVFEDGTGPWRSMSVYFLMLSSSFLRSISVSCL